MYDEKEEELNKFVMYHVPVRRLIPETVGKIIKINN